jgi:hypothetical protein
MKESPATKQLVSTIIKYECEHNSLLLSKLLWNILTKHMLLGNIFTSKHRKVEGLGENY